MPSVLIVDDLLSIHEMLDAVIQPTGFSTAFATDGEKALARYKAEKFDVVLADIDMKPVDGITLLKQIKAYDPNCVLIIMTAYASTESAIQALKYGAFDYLQKPFRVDELISTLKRGLEFRQLNAERSSASPIPAARAADIEGRLVGRSGRIQKLIQQVKKLAAVRTPVLLQGENGTGKSTIAEILHASAATSDAPLVRIDCSLSSDANFREGLLGQNGTGGEWISQARGGTLFLQHLQCLPMAMQKELVSVLRNTSQDFRLICTTNEDLEKLTEEEQFHDELFYRVASLPVALPPLRDRVEDIPLLVKYFCAKATNPHFDSNLIEFTDDALGVLQAYHWPGNLSELQQLVLKIAATTDVRIVTSQQLPMRLREVRQWPNLADYLAGQQKQYTERVVHALGGDRVAAAKILGVDVGQLS
ncbi:MAG: sigma-54-dependent Fis family transcriptional regulator [Opitutaceae bacterium]|nr:sigma-54-dependent Fis family transcriptional regulator [Opitutaceae bacterium]